MFTEQLGDTAEMHGVEIGPLQFRIQPCGLLAQIVGDGADRLLQRAQQLERQLRLHLVVRQLLAMQLVPAALHAPQWPLQGCWRLAGEADEGALIELGAVHATCPVNQVVRLVHQQADAPVVGQRQPVEEGAAIEVVVVVTDHHVRPACQLLAEVIGTDLMGKRHFAQGRLVEQGLPQRGGPRRGQAVVEAAGERAGFAMTGLVRVFAGLFARHQLQYPQSMVGVALQRLQRIQCQASTGRLGGEKEQLVQLLPRECLELREQGAKRLADAGRRLRHKRGARASRLVHRLGQLPLAGTKVVVGKAQGGKRLVARSAVGHFLCGPVDERLTLGLEEHAQLCCGVTLDEQRFLVAGDVEIDQCQFEFIEPACLTQQPAIDLRLRPVQLAMIGGLALQVAAKGLDLFQAIARRVVAIGTAAHAQLPVLPLQGDLALVAIATPGGDLGVPGDAFQRGGRGREAQIQIADLGGEFAERAHRDPIAHAMASAHWTWQTAMGRPC